MGIQFKQKLLEIKADIHHSGVARIFDKLAALQKDAPIVLYGAGRLAQTFLNYCDERDIQIACMCDRNKMSRDGQVTIVSPKTLRQEYPNAIVVVASHIYNDSICHDLHLLGFPDNQVIPCPCQTPYLHSYKQFSVYLDGYEWAYDFFKDELSKQLVLDKLRLHLCDKALAPNTPCDCYYEHGYITLLPGEVFVDGGAYTGDSAKIFIQKMQAKKEEYAHIYSFEADKRNYEKAVENLASYLNVDVVPKGLWRSESELVFHMDAENDKGSSSFVFASGSEKVRIPTVSLDDFFAGKNELPSFIKMDIEGAEKEALSGAAGIIRTAHPKLAICAYHKPEDIYELPQTLMGIYNQYSFALRQHAPGCWDTILYAV